MSHLVDTFDANEVVSQIDDFWLANINSTTSSTREAFIINDNNNNCIQNIYFPPSDSLLKILHSIRVVRVYIVRDYYIRIQMNGASNCKSHILAPIPTCI